MLKMVFYAWTDFVHLPNVESTRSETPRQLSQRLMKHHVDWVAQSETPCQLSQRLVKLHIDWVNMEWDSPSIESFLVKLLVNWVNTEWDSLSIESMLNETPHWDNTECDSISTESTLECHSPVITKVSPFRVDTVFDVESHSELPRSTWSLTQNWLSWRAMRLYVNWVTTET